MGEKKSIQRRVNPGYFTQKIFSGSRHVGMPYQSSILATGLSVSLTTIPTFQEIHLGLAEILYPSRMKGDIAYQGRDRKLSAV